MAHLIVIEPGQLLLGEVVHLPIHRVRPTTPKPRFLLFVLRRFAWKYRCSSCCCRHCCRCRRSRSVFVFAFGCWQCCGAQRRQVHWIAGSGSRQQLANGGTARRPAVVVGKGAVRVDFVYTAAATAISNSCDGDVSSYSSGTAFRRRASPVDDNAIG